MHETDHTGMMRRLTPGLWRRLSRACSEVVEIPAGTHVTRAGAPIGTSALLLDGLIVRNATDGAGEAQMVALQVPGDFVDLHGLPLGRLDHDVQAVSRARLALFPHPALFEIVDASAEDARALWGLTLVDAAIHRHWTFRTGKLRALAGMANFMCEMQLRMELCGRCRDGRFELPLTQRQLAEACGMSNVHVNRTLRELREAGICAMREGEVQILDRAEAVRIGRFDPGYLFLPWEGADGGP
ncbi:Crp/Fnr family transcriptional regulator [Albimonas pacifica]|uniref:cAMP-binding domain of CRP or a regulatory subunit of cAMP-dependent protein kinases n=1 Tax=Albimonas pacifica TaxID=1114924 RepID=A0A1I3LKW3_9RHOB|nr:Crp/Fnr family transcriptional regulator [Albimonas pacifica]SFI85411.1 cAMP-binding domain of CRP or a regulatory subunit of cAMP-dependent protein kinases [Albimonas pacifica]